MIAKSIIFFAIFSTEALCQPRVSDQTADQIEAALQSRLGPAYSLDCVFSIDSESVYDLEIIGSRVDKSDSTLKGAYIFTSLGGKIDKYTARKGCVGIYRNNHLIWLSDTVIDDNEERLGIIDAVMDLNADGTMEIVSCWKEDNGADYLWIFSWDGHTGKLISDINKNGQSVIASVDQYFELSHPENVGVYTIAGRWSEDLSSDPVSTPVVYTWNGHKFGLWHSGKTHKNK